MDRSRFCAGCMEDSGGAAVCPHCGWRRDSEPESSRYLPPGTVLQDQYVVGRALGQAGTSVTYLAWDQTLNCRVELKEFFPEGVAARLPDAAVAPRSGQEQSYRQNLEEFVRENSAALTSFRANGSAYLVMENVKELAIESPIGVSPSISGGGAVFSSMAPAAVSAPPVQQQAPARPWLKWAAAFFALLLAGGVAIEQQQRREQEAQQERERQREIDARRERELQRERDVAAQKERELQQQRDLAQQRERELRQQQGIIEAQQRELQRQRIERQRLAEQQRRQQQVLDARRTPVMPPPEIRRPLVDPPSRPLVTYEQSLARAQEALRRGSTQAAQLAAQTIQMDPSKPGGYEVLGYSRLYFFDDSSGAETAMRAAMARGGSAVFRVRHDHGNGNFQRYCSGVLMIRPSGISFAAADNSDRFDARAGEIQNANRNKLQHGSFHVSTSARNYNFGATGRQPDAEAALAVRLLGR